MTYGPHNEKADAGLQPDAGNGDQLRAGSAHNAIASMTDVADNPQVRGGR